MANKFAEQDFQISLMQYLDLEGLLGVAVPNEGQRSKGAAGRMIAAGLRKGFQDVLVFDRVPQAVIAPFTAGVDQWRASHQRGLLCVAELKRQGRGLRGDQKAWEIEMRWRGVPAFGPWQTLEEVRRDLLSIDVGLRVKL